MTKFLAYYHLRPIHDTKDFIGISEDFSKGNIIATIGRNVISITNIATQKEVCSWTVLEKLSSKVVYDKLSKKYVGVFGNTNLRCWDRDTSDLNKVKKLKFKKKILDLIPSAKTEVIVLYADGSCESLSSAIENRKLSKDIETDLSINIEIFQSKLFSLPNSKDNLLTYFLKKDNEMELVTILLNNELKPISEQICFKLIRHDNSLKLAGYTIVENETSPCLMTIWSDKRIFMLPLDGKSSPEDSPGNFISMLNVLNTTQTLSIIGLSKFCVVIYGANTTQEGGSLILFNSQYKVIKAKQFFKIFFDFSKLWVCNNYILLAMGQNLSVVTFDVHQELLSDMIGSQFFTSNECVTVDDLINEVSEEFNLQETIQLSTNQRKLRKSITKQDINEEYNNTTLADGNILPYEPYNKFEKEYESLCNQNMHVEIFTSSKPCEEKFSINLLSNFNADLFSRTELEIIASNLKKYGASEQEISEKLITLALKANLIEDIAVCLRTYSNIYERILVNVLKFSLQGITLSDLQKNLFDEKVSVQKEPIEDIKEYPCPKTDFPNVDLSLRTPKKICVSKPFDLVNIVLSCSFDNHSILRYIRTEIELDEALVLMQHLYKLIKSKEICLEERPETSIEFDDDTKILQWFGIILCTHFQKLSLSRDLNVIEILMKWNDVLLEYKNNIVELQDIAAYLYNIADKKNISQGNKYSKWYTIESITIETSN